MRPNMIFTVEPIFNLVRSLSPLLSNRRLIFSQGKRDVAISSEDNWTVFTLDGSL
jgi:hypothetical protein